MPGAKKQGKRRGGGKGKKGAKRSSKNVRDFASMSVSRTYVPSPPYPNPPQANTLYSIMNTTLSQFDRAVQCARAYQFYRIKNITLKIKPQFDTFAYGTNGYGKPKLYSMQDKSGALPSNVTLEALKQMGARPRDLDEKPLLVSWSPTVLTSSMTAPGAVPTTQPGQYKVSPWVTTNSNTVSPGVWNPNDVDHLGVYWYVDSTSYGGTGGMPYSIDVEVQFEFKKPLWTAVGTTNAVTCVPAEVDASPDGIVGGSDGITIPLSLH